VHSRLLRHDSWSDQAHCRRIASVLRGEGHDSVASDVTSTEALRLNWRSVHGAVLAASLHAGTHPRAAREFVQGNVDGFNAVPSWFVSVSLSAASANPQERLAAGRIARAFLASACWAPRQLSCVAGRLVYTQYSLLTRWLMRGIARRERATTDASCDQDFTDWAALDRDTHQFGRDVRESVRLRTQAEHYKSDDATTC
jgi:menaquinone-dependent protoporphyrinogen oxidase